MTILGRYEEHEKAFNLALFHGVIIPLILAFITNVFESNFTIVSSIAYVVFVSLIHLHRLLFDDNLINQIRAYEFMRVLSFVAFITMFTFIVILLLSF
jgi:hypothetical protein